MKLKLNIEMDCTTPIRQLFQSTIAPILQRRKNASTRGQGRVLGRSSLRPAWGLKMKYGLFLLGILFVAPQSAPANTPAFAHCGTYDSYILLYKSVQKFEELGKLHCGESVAITSQNGDYSQVQTTDGRLGWVPSSDLSTTAPPPQPAINFGWTEKPKPEPKPDVQPEPAPAQPAAQPPDPSAAIARPSESAPLLTDVNVMKMQSAHQSPDAIIAKISASRCDFDTSPVALHRLKLSGVSDRIILAMMHAPAAFPVVPADAAQTVEVRISNQTAVQVAVSGDVSADNLEEGSIVEMVVVQPVTLDGVTVIPQGAEARARIMAVRRSSMGSSGQVVWFMQDITAATGDRDPRELCPIARHSRETSGREIRRLSVFPHRLSQRRASDRGVVRPLHGAGGRQHSVARRASGKHRTVSSEVSRATSSSTSSGATSNHCAGVPDRSADAG